MKTISWLLIAIFLWVSGPAGAKIYRWVDKNGVAHFSDTPPQGVGADEMTPPSAPAEAETEAGPSSPPIIFELSGTVQDPDGRPVNGVDMIIIEHHYQKPGHYEFKTVRRKQRVSGTFKISCRNCPIHKLYFRKKGYFSREVPLRFSKEEEKQYLETYMDQMISGRGTARIPPQTIVRSGMKVILEPEGDAVRLIRIEAQLGVSPEGDLMVLTDIPDRLRGQGIHDLAEKLAAEGPPVHKIRLDASHGAFSAAGRALAAGTWGRGGGIGVYLDYSHARGGVLETAPAGTRVRENLRAMQTAPKGGYGNRLELIPSTHSKNTYFYFKLGRFFGKGLAVPPRYERAYRGRPAFFSHIELYLNPRGDRNLRGK